MRYATLHQLRIFEASARRKNFTRVAEELFLTQPTVSAQIKQLTDIVGMPLFEQIGKRISLTAAGDELYKTAHNIFEQLALFEMTIADMQGFKKGNLRISTVSTTKYFMPRFLGPFCHRYPGIDVSMQMLNREKILERLGENLDDLYVFGQPPENLDVEYQPFLANPLVVVAPRNHPLVGEKKIPFQRLAEEHFIIREAGSGTRMATERLFEQHGIPIRVRLELGNNEAIKQAIIAGLGISVLSAHTLVLDNASGEFNILDVEGFPLQRHWYAVYPTGKQLSIVARTFLDYLLNEGERLGNIDASGMPHLLPARREGSAKR